MAGTTEWSVKALREKLRRFARGASDSAPQAFVVVEGTVIGMPFRLEVFIAERFIRRAKKARLLGGPAICQALKNVRYGYDPQRSESPGGADGIFSVTPDYEPRNSMVRKLYDHFLFTEKGPALLECYGIDPREGHGVRVVCHHLRLLGFLRCRESDRRLDERLVLVDLDLNKGRA